MKDGTIFLQYNRKWSHWYSNVITWLITKMPVKGPFIHTQGYLRGWVYEYTINGKSVAIKRTRASGAGTDNREKGDLVLEPVVDLTEQQVDLMVEWWEEQVGNEYKYGIAKLLIQLILGWTRPFWQLMYRWFGIEVLKDNARWGEHCSASWDEAYLYAGIDIFPNESEQYTTPSAFAQCEFFKLV